MVDSDEMSMEQIRGELGAGYATFDHVTTNGTTGTLVGEDALEDF